MRSSLVANLCWVLVYDAIIELGSLVSTSDDGSQIIDARVQISLIREKKTMWNYDNERQTRGGS